MNIPTRESPPVDPLPMSALPSSPFPSAFAFSSGAA
ncbi:hypothetical protein SAMN05216588_101370 [Pseudomonas flavescens]|uniref:Uncharacterized protein n=1 Tax=Phytopseudomonas flavescens TaxID=29435 RepID=A0A1G7Y2A3_9GAMM|nr:hypothetical protein SAMN05216588_101370 [Pseudomonas flavescens]